MLGLAGSSIEEVHFAPQTVIEEIDSMAFGSSALSAAVYIQEGSWMDKNRDAWDIGFLNISYE